MLPRALKTPKAIRAFKRAGWYESHTKASHLVLKHRRIHANLAIPLHDAIAPGLLRKLISDAEMTVEEFLDYLQ